MLGIPLRYVLKHPGMALKDLAEDPLEIWTTIRETYVAEREQRRPQCPYESNDNWESRLHRKSHLIAASVDRRGRVGLPPSQPIHAEARVLCDRIEKRRQTTNCAERTDHRDDIDDLHDATPIQTHGDADSCPHWIRATFIGAASASGCPTPPRAL